MKLLQSSQLRVRAFFLAALCAVLAAGCLKAGDGLGLTERGALIVPFDSCKADSAAPGCPKHPCVLNPAAPGCPADPCKLDPTAQGCGPVDSCALNPSLPGCKAPGPDCSVLPKPVECLDREYFTANVLPIFKEKCEECHKPSGQAWSTTLLPLEPLLAWDSLVNIASREMLPPKPRMLRVKPGMPDSSYLFTKVAVKTPPVGGRMPLNKTALTTTEIETIRIWITGKP